MVGLCNDGLMIGLCNDGLMVGLCNDGLMVGLCNGGLMVGLCNVRSDSWYRLFDGLDRYFNFHAMRMCARTA